jgi:hypothetical protein
MKKSLLVNIQQGLNQLTSNVSNLMLLQFLPLFTAVSHQFKEIFFNVLKDEVGLIDDSDDLFEFDDVLMIHFSEGFYF